MSRSNDRGEPSRQRAMTAFRELTGQDGTDLLEHFGFLGELIIDVVFGELYGRTRLSLRDREIASIACLVAIGKCPTQLKSHIKLALRAGITSEEIEEVIIQTSVYAGIPLAMNAHDVLVSVTKED